VLGHDEDALHVPGSTAQVVRVGNAVEHREPSHTDEISVEEGDLADGDLALKRHPLL
jgi:hypothetical protein